MSADVFRRLCAALIGAWCAAGTVMGQSSTATIEVRVQLAGAASVPVPVRLGSVTSSQSWSADIRSGEVVRFRLLLPGRYRLIAGGAERQLEVWAGDELTVDVTGATAGGGNDVRVARTDRTAYGTQFNAAAIERLPESGGVYGLIERSDPLVVTELMEGGGAYLEPQRLGASGASWTQTSFRLGDADVTDPDRTGFAMIYPNLDTLQAVSVTTAGLPPDGYGCGTSVMLVPQDAGVELAAHDRVLGFAAGAAVGESASGRPVDRAAPGRERRQFRPQRAAERSARNPCWPGRLAASSRLERDSQDSMASRVGSLSAHLVYTATPRDNVRLFVETDRLSLPAAGRAMLVDPGLEQKDRTIAPVLHLESHAARRPRVVGESRATATPPRRPRCPARRSSAPWSDCATGRSARWRRRPAVDSIAHQ